MDFWNGKEFVNGNNNTREHSQNGQNTQKHNPQGQNARTQGEQNQYGHSQGGQPQGGQSQGGFQQSDIEEQLRQYQGRSQDDLMTELLSKASGMKANGTLDVGELEKFCNNASMFLSPEQVSRMRMIIGMLK